MPGTDAFDLPAGTPQPDPPARMTPTGVSSWGVSLSRPLLRNRVERVGDRLQDVGHVRADRVQSRDRDDRDQDQDQGVLDEPLTLFAIPQALELENELVHRLPPSR